MSGFNLSALAVRERSVTLFLLLAISIAGVVAFLSLGRAEDPAFTIKQMTVVTAWPGATAKEMEELVAEPLEKRMRRADRETGDGVPIEIAGVWTPIASPRTSAS
jgi:multidrug efflux pump subunit AcrB